ncbi:MAG TPA: SusC/RagA family TonB-linked outer membrane protein [Balneolaceae bacterium]|nr:SusC/RagA family TonB-linked outer membrane protein [Balneolaceae bacterium]
MNKKILTFIALCLAGLLTGSVYAQTATLSGKVTDVNSGESLPGANVVLKEILKGSSTDADGNYKITNIPAGTYTLEVSFIGYKKKAQTIDIGSSDITFDIALEADLLGLQEIYVTALGFEANRDEQGTSSSNVRGQEISQSGENNLLTGLSAKAAGVSIVSTSGDPGAGARINIRGFNTVLGNTQPLFVVDGVPVYNSTIESAVDGVGTAVFGGSNNVDGTVEQSRIQDLNPNDIASVEILKGPSAAALWGSRAANGVVIIKTKKGVPTTSNKLNIAFSSISSLNQINETPNLQTRYGQGFLGYAPSDPINGNSSTSRQLTWGPLLDPSTPVYNHARDVIKDGYSLDNNLSISGGDQNTTFMLSVGNLNSEGIIRNNSSYDRTSVRASVQHGFSEKLNASVNLNYSESNSDRIQKGSNTSGLYLGALRTPPDFDNQPALIDYVDPNGNLFPDQQRSFRNPTGNPSVTSFYDNPYFTTKYNTNKSDVNRFFGNTELSYNPTSWLNITHRMGIDNYTDRRQEYLDARSATAPGGQFTANNIQETQINSDLILQASHQFTNEFSGSALLGWNYNQRDQEQLGTISRGFILPDAPAQPDNANSISPFKFKQLERTSALYTELSANLYDQLYLKGTGRMESASTFGPASDKTYFYPSGSLAWQFTSADWYHGDNILNFGKIRGSYGEAGIQPGPYLTSTTFLNATGGNNFLNGWGAALDANNYGGGFRRNQVAGNPALKPEQVREIEIGTDLRFFDDRIGLSFSRYWKKTTDAILNVTVPASSGFTSKFANAAKLKNSGYEVELSAEWLRLSNFSWTTSINWSKNKNEVTDLAGVSNVLLSGFTSFSSQAVQGEPLGVIWGTRWLRYESSDGAPVIVNSQGDIISNNAMTDADGNAIIAGSAPITVDQFGFPVTDPFSQGVIGDPTPDWRAGISNTFKYKNLSLNVLVDIKQGGDVHNGTRGALYFFGTHGDQNWTTTISQEEASQLYNYGGAYDVLGTGQTSNFAQYLANKGVTPDADGNYTFRGYITDYGSGNVVIDETAYWAGPLSSFTGPDEPFVEDGGYVRLREVSLFYTFNNRNFRDLTGLSSIDVGVTGRNLILWTDYTGVDPETNLTGQDGNGWGLDYFNNPSTRSWIFTLRVNY